MHEFTVTWDELHTLVDRMRTGEPLVMGSDGIKVRINVWGICFTGMGDDVVVYVNYDAKTEEMDLKLWAKKEL
jgi:hypothetical protein